MTHWHLTDGTGPLIALTVTMPVWLPTLHDISEVAADVAPILGVVLLVLQITLKVYNRK